MGSERTAKQVKILDDMLMIMRLTRSIDRYTYYVDTGRSPPEEEITILKRWKRALSRKTYVDPASGRFDSRFDPFAWTSDIFWPKRQGSESSVEVRQGIADVKEIVDIDHFRRKLYGSLRAPQAYFGYGEDVEATKASISAISIKWARAVYSIQRALVNGLTRLCQIDLAYMNMDTSTENFQVMITPASILELLNKLEAWQNVVDVAERMSTLGETLNVDKRLWTIYILKNVLWLSEQDVKKFARTISKEEPPEVKEPEKEEPEEEPEPPKQFVTAPDEQPGIPGGEGSEKEEPKEEASNGTSKRKFSENLLQHALLNYVETHDTDHIEE
jgi:hypothetical protein